MRHGHPQRRRTGYSLIEMVVVIMLLGVFMVMASRLFMQCFSINNEAIRAGDAIVQTERIVHLLRADVWGASSLQCDDRDEVMIEMSDGSTVRWALGVTTDDDQTQTELTRTVNQDGHVETGNPMPLDAPLAFHTDGHDLYLTSQTDTLRLIRVPDLVGGGAP